jgi:hypothetical protein
LGQKALAKSNSAISKVQPIFRTIGADISIRDSMGNGLTDSENFPLIRPFSGMPSDFYNMMEIVDRAYQENGILFNVVNLMADFACRGLQIVHPNRRIEDFLQEWARKVELYDRASCFMNQFFRLGNVIINRETALLAADDINRLQRGIAQADIPVDEPIEVPSGELPMWYSFINPRYVDIVGGGDLATFAGIYRYGLRLPKKLAQKIREPKESEADIVNQIPVYILNGIRNGNNLINLDPQKISVYFYKKDDWQPWALPMTYPILKDIMTLNKLKLADLSALDGAISHIRLWQLGDLQNQILPTPAAIEHLSEILMSVNGGGALDLVWGPDLNIKETSTDVYRFLGPEKYTPTLNAIYTGLGIPTSMQGDSGGKGGSLDKYLSLKVLIERINYGRTALAHWLDGELRLVQRGMGFRFPAYTKFEHMVLTDEDAYLRLLVELVDRNIVAPETVQERFGEIPDIEYARIKRYYQNIESGKLPRKAGPYHDAELDAELRKLFAQTGVVTPSQVDVELSEKKPGEKSAVDIKSVSKGLPNKTKPIGRSGQGRPRGAKDSVPRKQKKLAPANAALFFSTRAWATEVQKVISEVTTPIFLHTCAKKSVPSLTSEEFQDLENFKFAVLCALEPYTEFSYDLFVKLLNNKLEIPVFAQQLLASIIGKYTEHANKSPTIEQIRLFQSEVYSLLKQEVNSNEEVENG